jgi:hypothetical protein|tara:strand:+ start:439 stop:777 length:339 start_codon:yes stop_codon:yes gene_type:complete
MKTINYTISGTPAIKILKASDIIGDEPNITVCNMISTPVTLDIYFSKELYSIDGNGDSVITTDTSHILNSFEIPNGRTLTLDKTDMSFKNEGFDMYIELGASIDVVDIIINI